MPYCCDLHHKCRDPNRGLHRRKVSSMEPNQNVETEEMVAESLVEEVSIDGMCGVY